MNAWPGSAIARCSKSNGALSRSSICAFSIHHIGRQRNEEIPTNDGVAADFAVAGRSNLDHRTATTRCGTYAGGTVNGTQFGDTYATRNFNQNLTPKEAVVQLGQQLSVATLQALQVANLPGAAGKYFASLGEIKMPTNATEIQHINDILAFAADGLLKLQDVAKTMPDMVDNMLTAAQGSVAQLNQFVTVAQYAVADPIKAAQDALTQSSKSLYATYQDEGTAMRGLISTYDGSLAATTQLASATQARYNTELQLAQQIAAVVDSSHQMFMSSADAVRYAVLDTQGQYAFLQQQSAALQAQLATAIDPTQINSIAQQLNDIGNKSFQLLSADQQKANAAGFEDFFTQLDAEVKARLDAAGATITADHNPVTPDSMAAALETMMQTVVDKMNASNTVALQAANLQVQAAQTPVKADANVTLHITLPPGVEASVA
jgi:hypothetical protein